MPVQVRRLIFSTEEIRDILTKSYNEDEKSKEDHSTLIAIDITGMEFIHVIAKIQKNGRLFTHEFDAATVCTAIINYCKDALIPIPRSARKAVHRSKRGLVFDIVVQEHDIEPDAPVNGKLQHASEYPTT